MGDDVMFYIVECIMIDFLIIGLSFFSLFSLFFHYLSHSFKVESPYLMNNSSPGPMVRVATT